MHFSCFSLTSRTFTAGRYLCLSCFPSTAFRIFPSQNCNLQSASTSPSHQLFGIRTSLPTRALNSSKGTISSDSELEEGDSEFEDAAETRGFLRFGSLPVFFKFATTACLFSVTAPSLPLPSLGVLEAAVFFSSSVVVSWPLPSAIGVDGTSSTLPSSSSE